MKFLKTVAVAGLLAASSYAISAVTFDAGNGTGFVGKGDVQLAFGWNNQALQANAAGVGFSYNVTDSYTATCTWITGEGTRGERTHNVEHTTMTRVNGTVTYEARSRNQITGFNLTGFGNTTSIGTVPEVGGVCYGNQGHEGTWTAVSAPVTTGGLYVTYSGNSVLLQY